MTADNDTPDLEALFDSIVSSAQTPTPPAAVPQAAPSGAPAPTGDSNDLQVLFDNLSAQSQLQPDGAGAAPAAEGEEWSSQSSVFNRIGQMARQLHNTLHELGYDKLLETTVSNTLPDAKDRLAYIANLTEQAACRVLNATDVAKPAVDGLENASKTLGDRWDKVFANQMSTAEFKKLAEETRSYLKADVPQKIETINAQLLEIMMAQDFQDLTGQVIKKVVSLAQDLENGLMKALIEVVPVNKRSEEVTSLMNGPVINAEGRTDVVVNQQQVDDLLDSLGF